MNKKNFYTEKIDLAGHPFIDDKNFEKLLKENKFGELTSLAISLNNFGYGILEIKD